MLKNILLAVAAIIFVGWLATSCGSGRRKKDASKKPLIAVSIPPQLFFVDAIAGNRVETMCLMESGADPETFDPSMSQLLDIERATVYMPIGTLPFEAVMLNRLKANGNKVNTQSASEGVHFLRGTHVDHDHSHAGHNHAHDIDPHVWSSPANARIMALNTLNALVKADPTNEDAYRANYARLEARIDSIDVLFKRVFSAPEAPAAFMVWHPSLSYFANDYGLTQIVLSGKNDDTSVKKMVSQLEAAARQKAAVCFYQKEFDPRRASTLSNELGIKAVEINPMNGEWEDEMQKLYDAFTLD